MRETHFRRPDKTTWTLRILPHNKTAIGRKAADLRQAKDGVVLFVPDWISERGDISHMLLPRALYPNKPMGSLHWVQIASSDMYALGLTELLNPDRQTENKAEDAEEKDENKIGANKVLYLQTLARKMEFGSVPELAGYVVGPPLPLSSQYIFRYLEEWYGLRKSQIRSDLPFVSPWENKDMWFGRLPWGANLLGEWLKQQRREFDQYDKDKLQEFFDDLKNDIEQMLRMNSHLLAAIDEALKFPNKRLPPGEPFVWREYGGKYWVRFSITSEMLEVKSQKVVQAPLLFVFPLMDPEHLGSALYRQISDPEVRKVLLTEFEIAKKALLDYETLAQWLTAFVASPENYPDWYGPDLAKAKGRYHALVEAFAPPASPLAVDYKPLTKADLDQRFAQALAVVEASGGGDACGRQFK